MVPHCRQVTVVCGLRFCLILTRDVLPGRRSDLHFRQTSLFQSDGSLTLCLVASFVAISAYLLAKAMSCGAVSMARRISSSILCKARSFTIGFAGSPVHHHWILFWR